MPKKVQESGKMFFTTREQGSLEPTELTERGLRKRFIEIDQQSITATGQFEELPPEGGSSITSGIEQEKSMA